ncbi:hypothetical protein [Amorphus sp. 3PC139-8]|uniref:hypothetical protein n=1 Tax=Amorphus sp. 3PC139-8 TaxID=2735676 RepID=UPI00345D9AFB
MTSTAQQPDDIGFHLSRALLELGTGPLAELRRMDVNGVGPPAYWHVAHELKLGNEAADPRWMQIVKILAILTPKGRRLSSDRLHERKRPLGRMLCDGGDPQWRPPQVEEPDGIISQVRLARFLALPADQVAPGLERLTRVLARTKPRSNGVDCTEIVRLLLDPANPERKRRLAADYYARLDRRVSETNQTSEEEPA